MGATRGRPQDPEVTRSLLAAAGRLLAERGFNGMSMDAVAAAAGIGKPAIYRRYRDKVELVTAVIAGALPPMEATREADPEARMRQLHAALPPSGEAYAALIGELMAERQRHPELMEAFRARVLAPRRAVVLDELGDLRARGVLRADVTAEYQLEALAGPLLVRAYAGLDTGPAWREALFDQWWRVMQARPPADFT